jgi:hypothetical protein
MATFSRRDFTRNALLATLCAPFVNLLSPNPARAAAGKAKYFLLFFSNGTDTALWSPKGSSESSISFSPMTELLAPIKGDITIIEKLDSKGTAGSHGSPGGLCGSTYGATPLLSIEQFISDGLKAAGIRTPVANLLLGGTNEVPQQTTFYRDNSAISPIFSPSAAYQAIFSGTPTMTSGGTPMTPSTADTARSKRRQKSIDRIKNEVKQLRSTLGNTEGHKLDLHLDSLAQLQARIDGASGMTGGGTGGATSNPTPTVKCTPPAKPTVAGQALLNSAIHLDLAINAFACDITRVAAVQFGHHQMCAVDLPNAKGDYHNDFMHSDMAPHARLAAVERWLCQQFVAAVQKLKSMQAPDGSGTLYEQTIILWARDMGDGPNHTGDDMRFVFSGGAGGYLKKSANGRYLQGGGESHQRALLSAAEAMGITNLSAFGDKAQSHVPLAGLAV